MPGYYQITPALREAAEEIMANMTPEERETMVKAAKMASQLLVVDSQRRCEQCLHYSNPKRWYAWFKCKGTTMRHSPGLATKCPNFEEQQ